MWPATTFEVRTTDPGRVAAALSAVCERIERPAGSIVFVSGGLAESLPQVAESLSHCGMNRDILVAAGTGVITERGEIEQQSAAVGLVWCGGTARAWAASERSFDKACQQLLRDVDDERPAVLATFIQHRMFDADAVDVLARSTNSDRILGGGTVGEHGGAVILGGKEVIVSPMVTMILDQILPPVVRVAHSCRQVAKFQPVTSAEGAMLYELGGRAALEVLNEVGSKLTTERLLLTLVAPGPDANEYVVRGIQGVEPARGALMLSAEIEPRSRVSFAVLSGSAARERLESSAREIGRAIAGAAPGFGLYVNCSGRGRRLYGAEDVDVRILRERFGPIPMAGLQSAFELAPCAGRPQLQLYTGVFALFTVPS